MRELREVPVVPGPAGVRRLADALAEALAGGPAVAPVPVPASLTPGSLPGPGNNQSVSDAGNYLRGVRGALRAGDPAAPLERDDVVAVVATSGSTAEPRGVLLTDSGVRAQAAGLHEVLGGPGDWVVSLPVHSVGGLMVLGRAILGGGRLHPDPSVGGASRFDPQQYAATVATARAGGARRLYGSLVPTQLRRLVDLGDVGVGALRSLDAVLSGAAATPPDLAEVLRDNGVRLLTSYGMSETSGGCAYDGVPLPGLSFRTDTPDGRSLGRLQVTGPSVAAGYRLHPDDPAIRAGTVFTADVGRIADDGTVVVVGRADEVVQVGGVNVALPAVADALRTRDEVADACVVSVPDREWGARIVAFVVPAGRAATPATGQAAPDGATLQAAVREQLGPAAVPRTVLSLAGIPLLATGKPDRRALLALVPPR